MRRRVRGGQRSGGDRRRVAARRRSNRRRSAVGATTGLPQQLWREETRRDRHIRSASSPPGRAAVARRQMGVDEALAALSSVTRPCGNGPYGPQQCVKLCLFGWRYCDGALATGAVKLRLGRALLLQLL